MDIATCSQVAQRATAVCGHPVDPGTVLSVFEKHKFMREIAARDALFSPYTLRVIREIAKEDEKRNASGMPAPLPDIDDIEAELS